MLVFFIADLNFIFRFYERQSRLIQQSSLIFTDRNKQKLCFCHTWQMYAEWDVSVLNQCQHKKNREQNNDNNDNNFIYQCLLSTNNCIGITFVYICKFNTTIRMCINTTVI